MELIDYLRMLRRRWRWILAATLIGVSLAVAYSVTAAKTYEATSEMFVGSGFQGSATATSAQSASQFVLDRMPSYASLISSPDVAAQVNAQTGLHMTSQQLTKHVTASAVADTVIIKVTAREGSAKAAADVANAAADSLGSVIEKLETPVGNKTPVVQVSLERVASIPTAPASPNKKIALGLGIIAGFGIGLLGASLREQAQAMGPATSSAPPAPVDPPAPATHATSDPSRERESALRALREHKVDPDLHPATASATDGDTSPDASADDDATDPVAAAADVDAPAGARADVVALPPEPEQRRSVGHGSGWPAPTSTPAATPTSVRVIESSHSSDTGNDGDGDQPGRDSGTDDDVQAASPATVTWALHRRPQQ